ncbi:MAG: putative DNA-binding domain-containing protein [Myxococcales bacterium]|nr:putative DNA-binding domain-containing protein [Polyangiaceae bacterium]MDW8248793.1 putative DNA-binding domain-containing protein [Myxococcales bacterium]
MTDPPRSHLDLAVLQQTLADAFLGDEIPPSMAGTRLAFYHRLVHGALDECVASILPRTCARFGERFWREVRRFYRERGPRTHYLRDVPSEFLAWWAEQPWPGDLPPYALDLARYEVTAMEVGAAPDGGRSAVAVLELGRPVVFQEAMALRRYRFAVHRLPEEPEDRSEPREGPVALLAYRDLNHTLRYLELSPVAAAILERLLGGATLQEAILRGAEDGGVRVDDALLQGTAALLGSLAERGVLLGGATDL